MTTDNTFPINTGESAKAKVQVSNDSGQTWADVYSAANVWDQSWSLQDLDISATADNQASVRIRWIIGKHNPDGAFYGHFDPGWSIDDVEVSVDATPHTPVPADDEANTSIDSTLSWATYASLQNLSLKYDVYFGTTNPPTTLVASDLSGATCSPGPLQNSTTYYWKVVADNGMSKTEGPVWQFSTAMPVHNLTQDTYYSTIQAAISAAADGNEIVVSPGTYNEAVSFGGKNIMVRSVDPDYPPTVAATTISTSSATGAVSFIGTETAACTLDGLTVTNTSGIGIRGYSATATIRNCTIHGCSAAGIYQVNGLIENCLVRRNSDSGLKSCTGTIRNCTIVDNYGNWGGGIRGCAGTIENSLIFGNTAHDGGGIYGPGPAIVRGCTVMGNYARYACGGVYATGSAPCTLENSIVSRNADCAGGLQLTVYMSAGGSLTVRYSDVEGGQARVWVRTGTLTWDTGNIDQDPMFANGVSFASTQDSTYDDELGLTTLTVTDLGTNNLVGQLVNPDLAQGRLLRVVSQPNSTTLVLSDLWIVHSGASGAVVTGHISSSSPCIDAGDPNGNYAGQTDIDGQARVASGTVDMGADEVQ